MFYENTMIDALKEHWPEYLIEAWCLGTFMVSACVFGVALFHPASPLVSLDLAVRTVLMGVAMGLTAILIICSPWGKRSGGHFNPAVTLTFFRLGKINADDTFFYVLFQFVGGVVGVFLSWLILGDLLSHTAVNFVVTQPGQYGLSVALAAELVIAFILMSVVLFTSNSVRVARFTPYFAAGLVALYIAVESPISGISMNPANVCFGDSCRKLDRVVDLFSSSAGRDVNGRGIFCTNTGIKQSAMCKA